MNVNFFKSHKIKIYRPVVLVVSLFILLTFAVLIVYALSVADTFSDETKIASTSNLYVNTSSGQVKLAEDCSAYDCGESDGAGGCQAKSAGEQGLAACKRCNGTDLTSVNVTDNTQDTEGSNTCSGTCKKCSSGSCANQGSSEDLFSACAGLDCDGGATKYYNGWTSGTCYYMLDVSAANHVCDGAGACKTAAVQCAASTQGATTGVARTTCKTQVGCTGTTAGSLGDVAAGSDTYDECTASYNACSGNNRIGPDGNCSGSGACNTTGLSDACATAGTCQTGGGCSAGSCVTVSNVSAYNEAAGCTAQCYGCSGGACVPIPNATMDSWGGTFCNATHYRCDGSGACTNPCSATSTTCQNNAALAQCTNACITAGRCGCVADGCNGGCTSCPSGCSVSGLWCLCSLHQYD